MTAIDEIRSASQSIWLDDLHRSLLDDGELVRRRDELAVTGITANPTIFERAVSERSDYDEAIADQGQRAVDHPESVFWDLAVSDVRRAADVLAAVHERTRGTDGFVSLELAPALAYDAAGSIAAARDLFAAIDRPNAMIKVPGTEPGLEAIEELIAGGVNVNVTLLFGVDQWEAVYDAHRRGLQARRRAGEDVEVASVASFFLSRIDHLANGQLPDDLRNRMAIATARLVHRAWERRQAEPAWQALADAGASPQRLLWASTSPKDPDLPTTHYVERLVAADTIDTMSWDVLAALQEVDTVDAPALPDTSPDDAAQVIGRAAEHGVDAAEVADELQRDGVTSFADSYDDLLECIREKARSTR